MEQLFWIESRDAKNISAIVHFPEAAEAGGKRPVVVYCHGFTANKTSDNRMGVRMARKLRNQGFLVVRFDYIGSGESEGEFETDTHFTGWLQDADTVISWIKALPEADEKRIGLIGHSLGGALVTHLSALNPDVQAVCALAPVSRLEENFKQIIIGPELWQQALDKQTIRDFYNKKYSLSPFFVEDLLKYDILGSARSVQKPFLIIHGNADQAVPYQHSLQLHEALGSKDKQIKILEREAHLFSEAMDPVLSEWFTQKL
ncbi:alpha/beta hydrolase [Ferviditalea candida]|uniref:Alpha/beta fold hydrolase n=1 Tax=Ferviditalea candida TaxID=3108399 RepID=A0ABU5ZMW1_9BACL|nr:alpha/beta fold hydrolase [Paenibacillaceae bacterium T2]